MKICTFLLLVVGFLCQSNAAFSQESKELSPGYYVVVGAYAKSRENVAQNYVEVLKLKGHQAEYGFNSSRGLYFVYLRYFGDLRESLQDMAKTRKQGEFADAWVRVVPGDVVPVAAAPTPTEKPAEPVKATSPVVAPPEEKPVAPVTDSAKPSDGIVVTDNAEIVQHEHMTLGNTEVFLSLYNGTNSRIVDGDVQVIDTDRTRLMTKVKGNEYLILPDPKSKSGQLTLVCDAFGYRKVQQEINYPLPLADTVKPNIDLMGTTIVINFDLVRYRKGDIATLYNVYFFNDAAIMRKESEYELNSLLQLMQENPKYKIRLHGHTNGNYHGKVITMGETQNFFSLDGSKTSNASAKDLSYSRADVIKQYLAANKIDPNRIEIKAWAGKRPIYDKHSVNAQKNVRVEVEILEE